ncbi:PREDICTED: uncharacterized protein LOC103326293 [Prunus mume]|uniref:Uncharacterized protein LOC103326293 n=1 Tax=Prunus mume TaxID=102107 RepID=A0ABM0NLW4_PRUMU|nr:PREDICTED: uncharacterized protein LOC103326293 [Prunus mume]
MSKAPCNAKTTPPFASHALATADGYSASTRVKRGKKKKSAMNFFLCFRSGDAASGGSDKKGQCGTDAFTYVGVGEKEGVAFPKVVPVRSSLTSDNEGDEDKCRTAQQRNEGRGGFSQVLKAVLSKTSLVKKYQKRKLGKFFTSTTTNESSITSSYNQQWPEEDVPRMISKTTPYDGVEEREDVVFPKAMVSPLPDNDEANEEKDDGRYQTNKGRRKLSRFWKAALFGTSLAKKIQLRKKGNFLERNESTKYNQELPEEEDPRIVSKTSSSLTNNSSIFTKSSSNSSSSRSSSRSLSKRIKSFRSSSSRSLKANLRYLSEKIIRPSSNSSKANPKPSSDKANKSFESNDSKGFKEGHGQKEHEVMNMERNKTRGCYKAITSLCFLLMSLLGLIFYGKMCAILCTSLWLFSVPLWTGVGDSSTNKVDKKKFILGGLLPRHTPTIHRQ